MAELQLGKVEKGKILAIFLSTLNLLVVLNRTSVFNLLITFANSLDPDEEWQNWTCPDLDPNHLTLW